ncbi:hypothetical protein RHGRI_004991 [Rhododendron griersonianum]|uniref:Uncharacterized protein n=1 Tax=Rhododendron griersonianum TaxID=479676 RepID=A0AAV6LBM8_9ERIC|nr:hypothetical protein RHGRI_004991 [Rhododendron griersonianum]
MIDSQIQEHLTQSSYEDPFEACLSHFNNIDEDSTIESVNIFLESFIDISKRNLCFVEPPFSESTSSLWDEQESNFELKPLPPDPSVEIVGPTEIMPALVTPNNAQIEEEKIVDENDQCSKEFECDFVIRAETVLSSHRILLEALFCKQTFPWYAKSFYHVSKITLSTKWVSKLSQQLLIKSHKFCGANPCIVNYKKRIKGSGLVVIFYLAYIFRWSDPQLFRLMLYDNSERLFDIFRFIHKSHLGNAGKKRERERVIRSFNLLSFSAFLFFFLFLCFHNLFCRCHTVQSYHAYQVYLTLYYFYVLVYFFLSFCIHDIEDTAIFRFGGGFTYYLYLFCA